MKTFDEFINESKIENLLETFKHKLIDRSFVIDYSTDEAKLTDMVYDLKKTKDHDLEIGKLGESLYVKVLRNNVVEFLIRISYHCPYFDFYKDYKKLKAILCVDILCKKDDEAVYQVRISNPDKYGEHLHHSGLKDKAQHKKIVKQMSKYDNVKYEDLEDDYYPDIKKCIIDFLENNGMIVESISDYHIELMLIDEE